MNRNESRERNFVYLEIAKLKEEVEQAGLPNSAKTENKVREGSPIHGGGEMGDRIHAFDWSGTTLVPFLHGPFLPELP